MQMEETMKDPRNKTGFANLARHIFIDCEPSNEEPVKIPMEVLNASKMIPQKGIIFTSQLRWSSECGVKSGEG